MIYKTLASYYDALVTDEEATQDWVDYTRKYVQKGKILEIIIPKLIQFNYPKNYCA